MYMQWPLWIYDKIGVSPTQPLRAGAERCRPIEAESQCGLKTNILIIILVQNFVSIACTYVVDDMA